MTIQEAIKSGKPFRRKGAAYSWILRDSSKAMLYSAFHYESSDINYRFLVEDILATDWEVKE